MLHITIEEFYNLDHPDRTSIRKFLKTEEKAEEFHDLLLAEGSYVIFIKRRIKELNEEATDLSFLLKDELKDGDSNWR